MQSSKYIGKNVNNSSVFDEFWEAGDYCGDFDGLDDEIHSVGEIFLTDYTQEYAERAGYNKFSISVFIKDDHIVKILRIGHWHQCDSGSDTILTKFSRSLEEEAEAYMETLTKSR